MKVILKRALYLAGLVGLIVASKMPVYAEDNERYTDLSFANVHSFLYIRSEPSAESEWVGKLYPDYAARVIGPIGEWTHIQSGNVTGYVYSKYIRVGEEARQKAQELVRSAGSEEKAFMYASPREDETGQAIVDYACQFIGNPYVWGGTSLTDGADCSGFVQSVFAHFGISLPRTTWDMEHVGVPVNYAQAVPGDIILYYGHVGIYMGDGKIVNAINSRRGIGILPATYANIITVRRLVGDGGFLKNPRPLLVIHIIHNVQFRQKCSFI